MRDGLIQQVDTPIDLYEKPVNKFVGGFMGSPAMNFLVGTVENSRIRGPSFDIAADTQLTQKLQRHNGQKVHMGIRPENLGLRGATDIAEKGQGDNIIKAQVEVVEPLGAETHILASVGGDQTIVARIDAHANVKMGDQIDLLADINKIQAFDLETERNIRFE
jgi:multiple sugar transport system ATP-binding protein